MQLVTHHSHVTTLGTRATVTSTTVSTERISCTQTELLSQILQLLITSDDIGEDSAFIPLYAGLKRRGSTFDGQMASRSARGNL
jgi:hypothetical protein